MSLARMAIIVATLAFFSFSYDSLAQQGQPGGEPLQQQPVQVDVNDEELDKFVRAVDKVRELQEDTQEKMIEVIESEGLDTNRFVQINNLQQSPDADINDQVTEDELESFNKAMQKVQTLQQDMQNKQIQAIEEQGIEVDRYVQIAQAAQQDPELLQRIQEKQEN